MDKSKSNAIASRAQWIVWALAVCVAILWWQHRAAYPFDDTFITFRYVKHLASGAGIVWNLGGPHTEGYTNFLLVLLLVPAAWLHLPLLAASQVIGAISTVTIVMIGYFFVKLLTGRTVAALVTGVILATDPYLWMNAMSGLETSLFTALILLAFYLYATRFVEPGAQVLRWLPRNNRRLRSCYIVLFFAILTRPEAGIAAVILFCIEAWVSGVRPAARTMLWFLIPLVAYLIWKAIYFGSILPNSYLVKVTQEHATGGTFFPGRGAILHFYLHDGLTLIIAIIGGFLGWLHRWRQSIIRAYFLLVLWIVGLSCFYLTAWLLMDKYNRFMIPMEVPIIILAVVGAVELYNWLRRKSNWKASAKLVVMILYAIILFEAKGIESWIPNATTDSVSTYRTLGEQFSMIPEYEHMVVATADAGVFPFFAEVQHLDLIGLNTTSIARVRTAQELFHVIHAAHPEVLFIPTLPTLDSNGCAEVFRHGHGLIGEHYLDLVNDPMFRSYKSVGRVPIAKYDMDILVNPASPFYPNLAALPGLLAPAKCFR